MSAGRWKGRVLCGRPMRNGRSCGMGRGHLSPCRSAVSVAARGPAREARAAAEAAGIPRGPVPPSLPQRCLEALSRLGGEVSTDEVAAELEASGTAASRDRVAVALLRLARRTPPAAVRLGAPKAARWRLAGGGP